MLMLPLIIIMAQRVYINAFQRKLIIFGWFVKGRLQLLTFTRSKIESIHASIDKHVCAHVSIIFSDKSCQ